MFKIKYKCAQKSTKSKETKERKLKTKKNYLKFYRPPFKSTNFLAGREKKSSKSGIVEQIKKAWILNFPCVGEGNQDLGLEGNFPI